MVARISVVLIAKNEATDLAACLDKLSWADEIVVLDGGSSDNTLEIAQRYSDKVFVDADWQGFGVQRQRAEAQASGDWIFMLDVDEHVTPELVDEIQRVVADDDRSKVYSLPRLTYSFGGFLRHGGWYPSRALRLYAKGSAVYGDERVHEKLQLSAGVSVVDLKHDLLHYSYKDMQDYLTKSAHYAAEWAMQRQQRGKRSSLLQGFLHGLGCFIRMYLLRRGFLDGQPGLLIAVLSAHSTFVKYADLWVRGREN